MTYTERFHPITYYSSSSRMEHLTSTVRLHIRKTYQWFHHLQVTEIETKRLKLRLCFVKLNSFVFLSWCLAFCVISDVLNDPEHDVVGANQFVINSTFMQVIIINLLHECIKLSNAMNYHCTASITLHIYCFNQIIYKLNIWTMRRLCDDTMNLTSGALDDLNGAFFDIKKPNWRPKLLFA